MARPLRIEFDGAWYLIMNQGRRQERIFHDSQDCTAFVDLLQSTSAMFRAGVAAYCLMPTHYHLLLQTSEPNLARAMRHLGGVYTQWFNRRHGVDGQLFRGRYKAILVGEEEYLAGLLRYIHRNPLQAGLATNLADYPWSSHHGYLRRGKGWKWLHAEPLLGRFADDPATAREAYLRFMAEDVDETIDRLFSLKKLPSILGTSEFVQSIKDRFFASKLSPEVPESRLLAPVSLEAVTAAVCEFYGVGAEELDTSVRGVVNEARDMAMYLARTLTGASLRAIGEHFKTDKYSTVGSAIARAKAKVGQGGAAAQGVEEMKKGIEIRQREI